MKEGVTSTESLDQIKLRIELDKLELERQKLLVERYKARWSAFGVGVPLLAVAATVGLGVWNQYQQSRLAFSLKAAEVIMATDDPLITYGKSHALLSLFPDDLPSDFAKSFDPGLYGGPDNDGAYRDLVNILTSNPEASAEVLRIWRAAYPDDKWVMGLQARLTPDPSIKRTLADKPSERLSISSATKQGARIQGTPNSGVAADD